MDYTLLTLIALAVIGWALFLADLYQHKKRSISTGAVTRLPFGSSVVNVLLRFARWATAVASGADQWLIEYRRVKAIPFDGFVDITTL